MTKRRGFTCIAGIFGLLALLGGCQPTATPSATAAQAPLPDTAVSGDRAQAVGVFHPGNLDKILDSDPCSIHMQHIEDALATFCAFNHGQLPDTLDELKDAAVAPGLDLNCPVTGQPYLYSRAGLFLPTDARRIVLWEPTALHNGSRLCLMVPRLEPGKPVTMELRLFAEADFQKAVPAIQ